MFAVVPLGALAAAVVFTSALGRGECCNARKLREAADIVQSKFREELRTSTQDCGEAGDQCRWDRDCCPGYECSLGAGGGAGLGLYCRRGAVERPVAASGAAEADVDPDTAWQQGGRAGGGEDDDDDSGNWMLAPDSAGRTDEEPRPTMSEARPSSPQVKRTDAIGELERLKERKREELMRENAELEKLFTEKEERELEQLRALKEDAEMEELRRLKELRLKRKLELIRELKELRRLKAEEQLDAIDEMEEQRKRAEEEGEEEEERGVDVGTTAAAMGNGTEDAQRETEVTTKSVRQGIKANRRHHRHKGHKGKEKEEDVVEGGPANVTDTNPTPSSSG